VTISQRLYLIALLAANRRENTFSRLPFVDLIREFVAFFERDIVEPTQYSLYRLDKQITFLVTISHTVRVCSYRHLIY